MTHLPNCMRWKASISRSPESFENSVLDQFGILTRQGDRIEEEVCVCDRMGWHAFHLCVLPTPLLIQAALMSMVPLMGCAQWASKKDTGSNEIPLYEVEMTLSATDLWWKMQTELRKTKEATINHLRSSRAMGPAVENFSSFARLARQCAAEVFGTFFEQCHRHRVKPCTLAHRMLLGG